MPQQKTTSFRIVCQSQSLLPDIPHIEAIYVEKEHLLPVAYGGKGIGEISTIPTAPAVANAYYAFDHVMRTKLPMEDTYYTKSKAKK